MSINNELKLEGVMELVKWFESLYSPSSSKAATIHVLGTKGEILILMQFAKYEPKKISDKN